MSESSRMTLQEYHEFVLRKEANQEAILLRLVRMYDYDPQAAIKLMRLDNASRGIGSDAGEVLDCIKRAIEYQKPLDETNLQEELGDVLYRIEQCASAIGLTIQDLIESNRRKLDERYREGFTNQEADEVNRDRAAERQAIEMPLEVLDDLWPTLNDVLEAKMKGWIASSEHSTPPDLPFLVLPGDVSRNWAARWIPMTVAGQSIRVPHWLRERMDQIDTERLAARMNPHPDIASRVDDPLPRPEQTGQGWAETPVETVGTGGAPVIQEPNASFGDGLKRDDDNSYSRLCRVCEKVRVHLDNSLHICPNCAALARGAGVSLEDAVLYAEGMRRMKQN